MLGRKRAARISGYETNFVSSLRSRSGAGFARESLRLLAGDRYVATGKSGSEDSSGLTSTSIRPRQESRSRVARSKRVVVIGAGWGGLSVAHSLSKYPNVDVTVVEASSRVGGLVRDGFTTISGQRPAEAGQHGFWQNYHNIFKLLDDLPNIDVEKALTGFSEQGQYSPRGLEAVWPVYSDQPFELPTGLAQAAYTKFLTLSIFDRLSAFPLVAAFADFDNSAVAWEAYDQFSFRDLCIKLGVTRRCYEEAFEPMILTGLFAPGAECSAAAALGMAYFFVLKSQTSFDVRWCRGNIGSVIFDPWVQCLKIAGVKFLTATRVVGFETAESGAISRVKCTSTSAETEKMSLECDEVVFAVGAHALRAFVQHSPELARLKEFCRFANLRGTGVLATRIFLDRNMTMPYAANACWGFDDGVGMTMFDINHLHGPGCSTVVGAPGSVIEVDYYHANALLAKDDDAILKKVKSDLDTILGPSCASAEIADAAIVRLPNGVNWYYPGSYKDLPDTKSSDIPNAYFVGDIVRLSHGSWSQEKAFVSGVIAANKIMCKPLDHGVIPLAKDEFHVTLARNVVKLFKTAIGLGDPSQAPSPVNFFWR